GVAFGDPFTPDPMATPALTLGATIQAHRIFGLLSSLERQRLAEALTIHRLDVGDVLDLTDDLSGALHWLVSGELLLMDDQHQPILALRAGESLAPLTHPGIASAQAQTPCLLARLDASLV